MGHNLKPGNELYLLKVYLFFKLIESLIATLNYFLFLLVCKLYKYGYILCITFWKRRDTQKLSGIYLVLTYIERWSRLSSLSVFGSQ